MAQSSGFASPSKLHQQHPNFQSNARPENVEDQARVELQRMEQRRNETTEAIAQELDEMHQIAADQKSKLDGQKARLGTLESNTRKMRGEIKVLVRVGVRCHVCTTVVRWLTIFCFCVCLSVYVSHTLSLFSVFLSFLS